MGESKSVPVHLLGNRQVHRANVEALRRFQILDSAPESSFDHIVEIAARVFDVPTVLVSLIDLNRQWFKARVGLDVCETSLDVSFCSYAVLECNVMVVLDATKDVRFKANPLVDDPNGIRFYAGAPLKTADGFAIGTLCLVDTKARAAFSTEDRHLLSKMASLVVDVMEGRASEKASVEAKKKLEDFTTTSLDVFWETDDKHCFSYIAPRLSDEGGNDTQGSAHEINEAVSKMIGQTRWNFLGVDTTREPWVSHIATLNAQQPFRDLRYAVQLGSSRRFFSVSGQPVFDDEEVFLGYRGATHDVTESEMARLETERLANSDPLTGLANRRSWNIELRKLANCKSPYAKSLLLLDLDRFKDINDALGHDVGDALLIEMAKRIVNCARDAVLVARLGGDEFAILLSNDEEDATQLSECIIRSMEKCCVIDGHNIFVEVSIGISTLAGAKSDGDQAMVDADVALRKAKSMGRDRFVVFDPSMRSENDNRIEIVGQLERALEASEFELHYQPQVRLTDNAIVGMEALLRWRHPERGLLTPDKFLDALETSSFDIAVGKFVVDQACRQVKSWQENGTPTRVGINVSARQLYGSNLSRDIREAINREGIDPTLLEVEVTERVALGNAEKIQWVLDDIRELGVSVAFDDFGTGFASLSSLMQFPLDRVKIDRRFVCDLIENTSNARLVSGVIGLCHSLGFEVIAEGVETAAQADFLRAQKCDEVQGYFYAAPLGMVSATDFISHWDNISKELLRVK